MSSKGYHRRLPRARDSTWVPAGPDAQGLCSNITPRSPVHAGLTPGVGDGVRALEGDRLLSRVVCAHGGRRGGQTAQSVSDQGVQTGRRRGADLTKVSGEGDGKSRACRACARNKCIITATAGGADGSTALRSTRPPSQHAPGRLPLPPGWGPCRRRGSRLTRESGRLPRRTAP